MAPVVDNIVGRTLSAAAAAGGDTSSTTSPSAAGGSQRDVAGAGKSSLNPGSSVAGSRSGAADTTGRGTHASRPRHAANHIGADPQSSAAGSGRNVLGSSTATQLTPPPANQGFAQPPSAAAPPANGSPNAAASSQPTAAETVKADAVPNGGGLDSGGIAPPVSQQPPSKNVGSRSTPGTIVPNVQSAAAAASGPSAAPVAPLRANAVAPRPATGVVSSSPPAAVANSVPAPAPAPAAPSAPLPVSGSNARVGVPAPVQGTSLSRPVLNVSPSVTPISSPSESQILRPPPAAVVANPSPASQVETLASAAVSSPPPAAAGPADASAASAASFTPLPPVNSNDPKLLHSAVALPATVLDSQPLTSGIPTASLFTFGPLPTNAQDNARLPLDTQVLTSFSTMTTNGVTTTLPVGTTTVVVPVKPTSPSESTLTNTSTHPIGVAAICGIIGGTFFLFTILALLWQYVRRRRVKRLEQDAMTLDTSAAREITPRDSHIARAPYEFSWSRDYAGDDDVDPFGDDMKVVDMREKTERKGTSLLNPFSDRNSKRVSRNTGAKASVPR